MSGKAPAPSNAKDPIDAPAVDPAMDDILASIRRILKDDDSTANLVSQALADGDSTLVGPNASGPSSAAALAAGAFSFGAPPPAPPPLPSAVKAATAARPGAPSPAGKSARTTPEPIALTQEMMVSAPNSPAAPAAAAAAASMMNTSAAAATAASVGELIRAVAADRHVGVSRAGVTLEDIVREEMRPMIKDWLDRHLPGMVERLVRAEIERVVSRAMA